MDVYVDEVREEDFDDVVRIFALLGKRYTCDTKDKRATEVFRSYLNDDRKVGLVARIDGAIVGTLLFEVTPVLSPTFLHARADGMAVDPAFRRMGIAHKLLDYAIQICRERNVTSFMVKASDARVIEMYRKMDALDERGVYFYFNPTPALVE